MTSLAQHHDAAAEPGSDAAPASAAAKEPWEVLVDADMLPSLDPVIEESQVLLLDVIRTLVKSPDDDSAAVARAVSAYKTFFRDNYLDLDSHVGSYLRRYPVNGSSMTESICEVPWELATYFPADSLAHRRLAEFVAGFADFTTADVFDPKDPHIPYDFSYAYDAARKFWNASELRAPLYGKHANDDDLARNCADTLSSCGFLARLLRLGALDADVLEFVFVDLRKGLLAGPRPAAARELLAWRCRAAVAAQHMLLGGDVMVREIRSPSARKWEHPTSDSWRAWAAALARVASTESDGAQWHLRVKARLAHEKMVDLWPEVFTSDGGEADA